MSRSKKKNGYRAFCCCQSEKEDKKRWHRRFRQKNNVLTTKADENAEMVYPKIREISNLDSMSKDGKVLWFTEGEIRDIIDFVIKTVNENVAMNEIVGDWFRSSPLYHRYSYQCNEILDAICTFFNIGKEAIPALSVQKINTFIEYFLDKQKRK